MPIPDNIEREHILPAINRINRDGVPPKRGIRKWAVEFENQLYPCKLIISYANVFINGEELDPHPNNFTTTRAQAYLQQKGFTIIRLNSDLV